MFKQIQNFVMLRSLFSKLFMGFSVVIAIVSLANYYSYTIYVERFREVIEETNGERLENLARRYDDHIGDIKENLLEVYRWNAFTSNPTKGTLTDYEQKVITDQLMDKAEFDYVIETAVVLKDTNYVLTKHGAYDKEKFFISYYYNEIYSEAFWYDQMKENFAFEIYPVGAYEERTIFGNGKKRNALPMAFKSFGPANAIFLTLVDMEKLSESMDSSFNEDIYVYDDTGSLLFPDEGPEIFTDTLEADAVKKIENEKGIYFSYFSAESDLIYVKRFDNSFFEEQSHQLGGRMVWILAGAALLSIALAFIISNSVNRRAKRIYRSIKKTEKDFEDYDIVDLKTIGLTIDRIISDNLDYVQENDVKTSMLRTFMLQSAVKDIYTDIEALGETFDVTDASVMVVLKIHYTNAFHLKGNQTKAKACYLIRQLFELYLKEYYEKASVFQTENDMITALIELDDNKAMNWTALEGIMKRFESESDYMLFTMVTSTINTDVTEMNSVYNELLELLNYRPVEDASNWLRIGMDTGMRQYSYTMDQSERFVHLVANGESVLAVNLVKEVLRYNVKQGTGEKLIRKLCEEMIKSLYKVVIDKVYTVPQTLKRPLSYDHMEQMYNPVQYEGLVCEATEAVTDFLENLDTETDHIIDYVKGYVEAHYEEDIYVEMLAEQLKITKTYLSTYFKSKTGVNLSDYIISFRMNQAEALLIETDLKVKDIGVKVGVKNINTFIRNFKKHSGQSPGEFRKKK